MDTKYFSQAVKEWCAKNKWARDLPMTPAWLSDMLQRAQALKEEDRKRLEAEGASA